MKKIYSLLLALFAVSTCFAQSQRLVLMEEFTQASCPPCGVYNPGFNAILNANPTKIVSIKYQVNWPGYDPMNVHNPSEVASRVSYYGVSGVPDGVMDGGSGTSTWHANPANFSATYINNRYAVSSPFTVNVSHFFTSNHSVINVHVDVTASQAFSQASNLRIAVIERDIEFCFPPGTNGETLFEGVMVKMLPNVTGTVLPASWTSGQTQSYDFQWTVANIYDKNTLAVVAFVQNTTSKEVHQTGYSAQQQLTDDARITCTGITIPALNCTNSVTPTVEFENLGSNTLTSLAIDYQLDAGSAQSYTWNGSLATGATTTVTLPAQTVTAGSHSFTATTTNPNGVVDVNTYYDNSSKTFSATAAAGAALPLVQDFVSTVFPPTNWLRNNPDNGPTWTRVTAGNVTTGSAKIDFYNSPLGQVDELITPGYDFAGNVTSATLDFDVAYCQYSNENDRLQVQLSTDCGVTWTTPWDKSGSQLAFGNPPYSNGAWTPTSATQWHHQTVSLNTYVGNPNVFLKLKATSAYGNNGYVDNINVSVTTGVQENTLSQHVNVYPIPSSGIVNLDVNFESAQNLKVAVYNLIGDVIKQFEIAKTVGGLFPIDLSKVADGAYTVKISTDAETIVKSINIVK